jgi:peroxiredoxin
MAHQHHNSSAHTVRRRPTSALTLALLCSLLLIGCSTATVGDRTREQSRALQEVQQIALPTTSGASMRLADQRGKIVMLHFFSSGCRECAREATSLNNLYRSFKDSPFALIAIDLSGDPYQAHTFAARFGLPFPVAVDPGNELQEFFSVRTVPTTLFLDRSGFPVYFRDPSNGTVSAKVEGARAWDTAEPTQMIAGLVEQRLVR